MQLHKRQGIHCPNHLYPATWMLEWMTVAAYYFHFLPLFELPKLLLTPISGIFGIQNGHLAHEDSVFGMSNSIYVYLCDIVLIHRCDGFYAPHPRSSLKPSKPQPPKVWGKQSFQLHHEG